MKKYYFAVALFALLVSSNCFATIRFVDAASPSPVAPYTNWAGAAHVIQDAVDASQSGDTLIVTNGIYNTGGRVIHGTVTNRAAIDKPISVQSVNGASVTFIEGNPVPDSTAVRCAYLTNGASLSGFTLRSGATLPSASLTTTQDVIGGGVSCESTAATLSNCTLTANSARWGGAVGFGSLWNCTISNNSAVAGGGVYWCILNNCLVASNSASDFGGGLAGSRATNCTIVGNYAYSGGGGADGSGLYWSRIIYNTSMQYGGGGNGSSFNNCLVASNVANISGGGSAGGLGDVSRNTTFRGNFGGYCGGVLQGAIYNCVVAQNKGTGYGGTRDVDEYNSIVYANTGPIPSDNFTNDPGFVNLSAGDFHLQSNSPCINSGVTTYAPPGPDLDNHPRVVGGAVDLGPYEFQTPTSLISYAWLAQYGFPNDGSADFADPDHDGMDNFHEWLSNTDPTNPNSVLKVTLVKTNSPGTTLSWKSAIDGTYYVQRTANILAPGSFQTIKTNIFAQRGDTVYFTDTNRLAVGSYFYRVGTLHW